MLDANWGPQDLMRLSSATWAALTLQAAVKLDLFTTLDRDDSGLTAEELAQSLNCQPRALSCLVTALCALRLLERRDESIRLTDSSRRYLSADSADYCGALIRHGANLLPSWLNLIQTVKTGRPASVESDNVDEKTAQNDFLMGMFNSGWQTAPAAADILDFDGRKSLLDLGGGPGAYAIQFCLRHPELKAVIFDLPHTAPLADTLIRRHNIADRVSFIGGDFLNDQLPAGFEVVWLSQVLHMLGPDEAARLVERAAAAIGVGGLMVVQEFILDDDRCGPTQPALFALNMLLRTQNGRSYTEGEIKGLMAGAGLTEVQRLPRPLPTGGGLIIGVKRAVL